MGTHVIARRRWHRGVFLAAGIYNIAWGLYAAIDPQWLFRFSGMPLLNHPAMFMCIGMIVGVYGLLYIEIARRPEHGFAMAAVGLLGKVLGPVGIIGLIASGQWPLKSAVLCAGNDLLWWAPFALYLYDAWPFFRATLGATEEPRLR